jgi:UDP-N-acetylglucosamine 1-carboxyvinyltransferase
MKNSFVITGGTPLHGSVKVGGAKNASYKIMIAALLGNGESRILNLPEISDVEMVAEIISSLGAKAKKTGDQSITINPVDLIDFAIDKKYGEKSRASTLFLPVLLAKLKKAQVPLPGGDKIGKRPLERHLEGLEKMGAKFVQENGFLKASTSGLKGVNYKFSKNTHTGTETLVMAAVLAEGKTVLENAALEPEVDDLIDFLNKSGAKIKRLENRVIEIEGVKSLGGCIHKIMPDRNETVSYACAAIASKGDIIVENAREQDLKAFLEKLKEAGAGIEIENYGIRFFYQGSLKAVDIETKIHPGFMTDWQPLWATLVCHAEGVSVVHETVMQNRFQYVETLKAMGAKIEIFTPEVKNPESFYNFNFQDANQSDIRAIKIYGPTQFKGGEFTVHDLRAGATIMLAAISGKGQTTLHNIEQIDRGYQQIDEKLRQLGASITRS